MHYYHNNKHKSTVVSFFYLFKGYDNKISTSGILIDPIMRKQAKARLIIYVQTYRIEMGSLKGQFFKVNTSFFLLQNIFFEERCIGFIIQ